MYKGRAVPHEDSWELPPVLYPSPGLGHRQATRFVMETTIRLLRCLVVLFLCVLTASLSQAGRSSLLGGAVLRQASVNRSEPPRGRKEVDPRRMSSIGR